MRRVTRSIWRSAALAALGAFFAVPLYWLVTMAFKPVAEWNPPGETIWWPRNPTLENFREVLGLSEQGIFVTSLLKHSALGALRDSLVAAGGGTLIALVIGTLAAYGIARFGRGRRLFAFQLLQVRMFPPLMFLVPLLFLWVDVGLYDTLPGLALAYAGFTLPLVVWLMRGFFLDVPCEVAEAAIVDGCSHWGVFVKAILPLVKHGLAVTALIVFVFNWSDLVIALSLTQDRVQTGPVFLQSLQNEEGGQLFGIQAAVGLLLLVPVVLVGIVARRYLARGLTLGAIR